METAAAAAKFYLIASLGLFLDYKLFNGIT